MLKCLIDLDVPVNAGFYEQVRLIAPEGTVVNCTAPSPVVGGWETQVRLTDIILKALHSALPDQIPASTKGTMCQVGFGGKDPRSGQLEADTVFSYRTCGGGGYGPPQQRDPQAVARDVREGKVNIERARSVYGVVMDGDSFAVDPQATEALRERMAGDGV